MSYVAPYSRLDQYLTHHYKHNIAPKFSTQIFKTFVPLCLSAEVIDYFKGTEHDEPWNGYFKEYFNDYATAEFNELKGLSWESIAYLVGYAANEVEDFKNHKEPMIAFFEVWKHSNLAYVELFIFALYKISQAELAEKFLDILKYQKMKKEMNYVPNSLIHNESQAYLNSISQQTRALPLYPHSRYKIINRLAQATFCKQLPETRLRGTGATIAQEAIIENVLKLCLEDYLISQNVFDSLVNNTKYGHCSLYINNTASFCEKDINAMMSKIDAICTTLGLVTSKVKGYFNLEKIKSSTYESPGFSDYFQLFNQLLSLPHVTAELFLHMLISVKLKDVAAGFIDMMNRKLPKRYLAHPLIMAAVHKLTIYQEQYFIDKMSLSVIASGIAQEDVSFVVDSISRSLGCQNCYSQDPQHAWSILKQAIYNFVKQNNHKTALKLYQEMTAAIKKWLNNFEAASFENSLKFYFSKLGDHEALAKRSTLGELPFVILTASIPDQSNVVVTADNIAQQTLAKDACEQATQRQVAKKVNKIANNALKNTPEDHIHTLNLTCSCCFDSLRDAVYLPCGHVNDCYSCAIAIFKNQQCCPTCRSSLTDVTKLFYT